MNVKSRNLIVTLSVLFFLAFVAGMIALTLSLGGGQVKKVTGNDPGTVSRVEVFGPGEVQKGVAGERYAGRIVAFDLPKGTKNFSRTINDEIEEVVFNVGDKKVRVSTTPAVTGVGLDSVTQVYGPNVKKDTINGQPVYVVSNRTGNTFSTLIIAFSDGRWTYFETSGPVSEQKDLRTLARRMQADTKVAKQNSLIMKK